MSEYNKTLNTITLNVYTLRSSVPVFIFLLMLSSTVLTQMILTSRVDKSYVADVQCEDLNYTIVNGRALTTKSEFYYGDKVTYLCNLGFLMNGTNSPTYEMTCQADGSWNRKQPSCQCKPC